MRHVCLTLATLAIVLKVLVPPGFMAGPQANDLPFALVLCTSQGAMVVDAGGPLPHHGDDKGPAGSGHDGPCIFAGHGLGAPPPTLVALGAADVVAYAYRPQAIVADIAPSRLPTGPPLPARGPPSLLI